MGGGAEEAPLSKLRCPATFQSKKQPHPLLGREDITKGFELGGLHYVEEELMFGKKIITYAFYFHFSECVHDGKQYDSGDVWLTSDQCDECYCRGSEVSCRRSRSCPDSCEHGLVEEGQCCSSCTGGW